MFLTAVIVLIVAFFFLRALYKTEPVEESLSDITEFHDHQETVQEVVSVEQTGKMMNEDQYWMLISISLAHTSDQENQASYLTSELQELSPEEMVGFRLRTDRLLSDSHTSDLWCAAFLINGGCSDDAFEYFRCWLISRGKEAYNNAKKSADSLINQIKEGEEYEFEEFAYIAMTAFKNETALELDDYIDYDKVETRDSSTEQIDFTWEEENPDSMQAICPKIFAQRWHEPQEADM
ncbi:MAG: DUF4240 domain-containing protein [Flavobacteriales bacterium]|nr:DUF4240 domain-containing protein [Flavobacteriales bacterium]